ncbi:unnamed protein product [Closterium sp. Yama58-4]|nr:unnamed protein product [Closterium sp. Yama58-4]
MMQVFPIIISDLCVGRSAEERDQRDKEVRAFRYYAVFYKSLLAVTKHTRLTLSIARQHGISLVAALHAAFPKQKSRWNFVKLHEVVHLIDGISMRGLPHEYSTELWEHTHKGTVKGPVRGSNWKNIPRRIVEEETQREIIREIAALSGGGRTYYTALREAVRNMKPALTRTSKAMCLMTEDDPMRTLYRETVGSEFDNMASHPRPCAPYPTCSALLLCTRGCPRPRALYPTCSALLLCTRGCPRPRALYPTCSALLLCTRGCPRPRALYPTCSALLLCTRGCPRPRALYPTCSALLLCTRGCPRPRALYPTCSALLLCTRGCPRPRALYPTCSALLLCTRGCPRPRALYPTCSALLLCTRGCPRPRALYPPCSALLLCTRGR